jgi:hypothetical protein
MTRRLQGNLKNTLLEDKLAHDIEFDVIGILNLSSMNMTDDHIPMIIQRAFCGERKKCIGLNLHENAITSNGVKMIVDAMLATRSSLKHLNFSNNPDIGDVGIQHLIRLLQNNRTITFLALPNTGITDRGVRRLANLLCGVPQPADLLVDVARPTDILYNIRRSADVQQTADVVCDADTDSSANSAVPPSPIPPLEKLYIPFNKLITDKSLEAILQILEQNHTLKVLSLQHCGLSDKARKRLRLVGAKMKKKKFSLSE